MYHTLGEAAKATGKQKSTILDSIRKGRISAQKNDFGQWQIDPAELHRLYPPVSQNVQSETDIVQNERDKTIATPYKIELLQEKIRFLERELNRFERTEADLKEDRDDLRRRLDHSEQARDKALADLTRLTLMLTDQREKKESSPTSGKQKKGFWRRLLG